MTTINARRLAQKKWRDKNIGAERARCAKWCRDNKEKRRQYKLNHRAKILKRRRELYLLNHNKELVRHTLWRTNNREKCCAKSSKYAKNNYAKRAAWQSFRRALQLQATPLWLTEEHLKRIEEVYIEAARLTKETGVKYSVDHIYPLQGIGSIGLHVPWNLRVITFSSNSSKKNRLPKGVSQ